MKIMCIASFFLFHVPLIEAYDLTLGLLLPKRLTPIADLAINDINNEIFTSGGIRAKKWVPKQYEYEYQKGTKVDTFCLSPIGLTSEFFFNFTKTRKNDKGIEIKGVDAYIGPVGNYDNYCEKACEWAAYMAAYVNKAMFSPACQETKRNYDRAKIMNDVFVRTAFLPIDFKTETGGKSGDQAGKVGKSVVQFNRMLDAFKWTILTVVVSSTNKKYYDSAYHLHEQLKKYNKTVEVADYIATDFQNTDENTDDNKDKKSKDKNKDEKFNRDEKFNNEIDDLLEKSLMKSRIFFLHGSDEENARILVRTKVSKKKDVFKTECVFITTEFQIKDEWFKADWFKKSGLTKEQAFDGFLDFSTPNIANAFKNFSEKVKASNLPGLQVYKNGQQKVIDTDAYLYDAIKLYAVAYKQTKEKNKDPDNITNLMETMAKVKFSGASGTMQLDNEKDRRVDSYVMKHFKNGTIMESSSCTTMLSAIIIPCDEFKDIKSKPDCGFNRELCENVPMINIVFITIAVILIGLTIAAFVLYKRNKYGNNDLVGKGFVIDAEEITKMMSNKNETESNPSYEQNGKAGGSVSSKSPMLNPQKYEEMEMKKIDAAEKIAADVISIASNESMREKNVFKYKGQIVMMKRMQRSSINLSKDKDIKNELKTVKDMHDTNLCAVVSVCVQSPHVCIIEQYCSKRSLMDVLQDEEIDLDMMFKLSMASDIANGATELHRHNIIHGRLTSSNCVIDNRWVCKITDYGMHKFREEHYENQDSSEDNDYMKHKRLLWRAPELLSDEAVNRLTKEGDVYSFGIILSEIITREDPYAEFVNDGRMELKDVIDAIRSNRNPPFRPQINDDPNGSNDLALMIKTMRQCWDQNPARRPAFDHVKTALKPKGSMMDNMIDRLEKYAVTLEERVGERTEQLNVEKAKSDDLLYKMLPVFISDQLKNGKEVFSECFESVTIFFSDIVGFTSLAGDSTPMEVVALLNDLYTCFDNVIDPYDVYKVETIGDSYMVVSGLPVRNGDEHTGVIATMSLDLLHNIKFFKVKHRPDVFIQLRIGMHSGPAVAGVVGLKMPRYCLFGDTVNSASRMESSGLALRIHVSPQSKDILDKLGGYQLNDRGLVYMKGKGEINTYFLVGKEGFNKSLPDLKFAVGLDAHEFK